MFSFQGTGGDSFKLPPISGPAPDQETSRAGNKVTSRVLSLTSSKNKVVKIGRFVII